MRFAFLCEYIPHLTLDSAHFLFIVNFEIMINELDVLAGNETPSVLLYFRNANAAIKFRLFIVLSVSSFVLPIMVDRSSPFNLLRDQPPVRYRGRTWIRIGPRRDIASPAEETMLAERKARNFTTFDAHPCFGASLDDLDLDLFQHDYLPKAVDAEVLAADDRPIERKLESLRFFNSVYGLPTNAAILLFGKDPRRFFPGAYVQYVNFGGLDKAATILNEHPFKGPIVRMLAQIDLFIETTIARKRPVFVTALREETRTDYPKAAIRELVMNAIMHRDYQGNAPIHFYQYADRLEIVNHGGLYGRARPENFPNVSDYRNPIIAEAMKVLGYVNCYNRGINMVQDELEANGNGKAEFSFRLITAFEAKVALAGKGEGGVSPENDPINDPMLPESDTMNGTIDGTMALRIVSAIEKDPSVTMDKLSEELGVARRSLVRYMNILQDNKRIKRVGGKRFGLCLFLFGA